LRVFWLAFRGLDFIESFLHVSFWGWDCQSLSDRWLRIDASFLHFFFAGWHFHFSDFRVFHFLSLFFEIGLHFSRFSLSLFSMIAFDFIFFFLFAADFRYLFSSIFFISSRFSMIIRLSVDFLMPMILSPSDLRYFFFSDYLRLLMISLILLSHAAPICYFHCFDDDDFLRLLRLMILIFWFEIFSMMSDADAIDYWLSGLYLLIFLILLSFFFFFLRLSERDRGFSFIRLFLIIYELISASSFFISFDFLSFSFMIETAARVYFFSRFISFQIREREAFWEFLQELSERVFFFFSAETFLLRVFFIYFFFR